MDHFSNTCKLFTGFKMNVIMFEERIFVHTISIYLKCVIRKVMNNGLVSEIQEKYRAPLLRPGERRKFDDQ
jgi:hypothetical protein